MLFLFTKLFLFFSVFVVQPTCPPVNDHIMELLIMLDAAKRASAARVTAVLPFYGYIVLRSFISALERPGWALVMLGLWSAVLTMSGKYDDLLTYTTFASLLFNAATAACVLVLRKSLPDERRPYRALGYPVSTLAFIFVALGFVIYIVQGDPRSSLYGLGLVLLGVPAYFLMNRESSSPKP